MPDWPIQVGHWVEIVGDLDGADRFLAREIRIIQPAEHETLFGRIEMRDDGTFVLLGQPGYFRPGSAFDVADKAFRMQLEARFRY